MILPCLKHPILRQKLVHRQANPQKKKQYRIIWREAVEYQLKAMMS
jgi:hypothetical protein